MKVICDCGKVMIPGGGQFGNVNLQNFKCECGKTCTMVFNEKFEIKAVTGNEDEEKKNKTKELMNCIDLAGIKVYEKWTLENSYSQDKYSPWFLLRTDIGFIKIGWRYRVINIEYDETMGDIATKDDVTHGKGYVHANSYSKAIEYLTNIHKKSIWINEPLRVSLDLQLYNIVMKIMKSVFGKFEGEQLFNRLYCLEVIEVGNHE